MEDTAPIAIEIDVAPRYLDEQSAPGEHRYVFAYTIDIHNRGRIAAQLISRHWVVTDGNGRSEEIRGEGVVGEQPHLRPGESYRYTSGVVLETEHGQMHGEYQMLADDGTRFEAAIAPFVLSVPRTLH